MVYIWLCLYNFFFWGRCAQRYHVNQIGSQILASSCFDSVSWHWGCPHWIPMIGHECVRALGGSDVVYVLMPWDIGINTQTLDVSLVLLTSQTCQISCACRIPWMYTRPRHEWGDIMKRAWCIQWPSGHIPLPPCSGEKGEMLMLRDDTDTCFWWVKTIVLLHMTRQLGLGELIFLQVACARTLTQRQ